MSIKSLALIAAVCAGTLAFESKANAQVYYPSGYYYSPGVVTASYYTPEYYGSYYYPYYGSYYYPYYGSYYSTYPYRGFWGARRFWWW